jgi:uncharacterized membrane protein (DUF485 family)
VPAVSWPAVPTSADSLAYVRADVSALRRAHRSLRRRTVTMLLGSYLSFATASCLAPTPAGTRVLGNITLGVALSFGQVGLAATVLVRHARQASSSIEPLTRRLRHDLVEQRPNWAEEEA